jgi:hypothetical protein
LCQLLNNDHFTELHTHKDPTRTEQCLFTYAALSGFRLEPMDSGASSYCTI